MTLFVSDSHFLTMKGLQLLFLIAFTLPQIDGVYGESEPNANSTSSEIPDQSLTSTDPSPVENSSDSEIKLDNQTNSMELENESEPVNSGQDSIATELNDTIDEACEPVKPRIPVHEILKGLNYHCGPDSTENEISFSSPSNEPSHLPDSSNKPSNTIPGMPPESSASSGLCGSPVTYIRQVVYPTNLLPSSNPGLNPMTPPSSSSSLPPKNCRVTTKVTTRIIQPGVTVTAVRDNTSPDGPKTTYIKRVIYPVDLISGGNSIQQNLLPGQSQKIITRVVQSGGVVPNVLPGNTASENAIPRNDVSLKVSPVYSKQPFLSGPCETKTTYVTRVIQPGVVPVSVSANQIAFSGSTMPMAVSSSNSVLTPVVSRSPTSFGMSEPPKKYRPKVVYPDSSDFSTTKTLTPLCPSSSLSYKPGQPVIKCRPKVVYPEITNSPSGFDLKKPCKPVFPKPSTPLVSSGSSYSNGPQAACGYPQRLSSSSVHTKSHIVRTPVNPNKPSSVGGSNNIVEKIKKMPPDSSANLREPNASGLYYS